MQDMVQDPVFCFSHDCKHRANTTRHQRCIPFLFVLLQWPLSAERQQPRIACLIGTAMKYQRDRV